MLKHIFVFLFLFFCEPNNFNSPFIISCSLPISARAAHVPLWPWFFRFNHLSVQPTHSFNSILSSTKRKRNNNNNNHLLISTRYEPKTYLHGSTEPVFAGLELPNVYDILRVTKKAGNDTTNGFYTPPPPPPSIPPTTLFICISTLFPWK